MNFCSQSGHLRGDAHEAWSPPAPSQPARKRLFFELWNKDSRGHEVNHKIVVDEPNLIGAVERYLTAGRTVFVHGELTSRPFESQGVIKGYVREIRALAIEVPNRSNTPAQEAGEAA
ncbi:hypothetical protein [Nibricoccus sp. IMCC34717]|uniref:hypothetical protein n=1 Tax=Nibricoccus sp. IMCC34717 TaxID=3034021 RepID=UPI00384F1361